MFRQSARWLRNRPLVATVLVVCVVIGVRAALDYAAELAALERFTSGVEELNGLDRDELRCVSWTFPFRDTHVTVTARLTPEELSACESIATEDVFGSSGSLRERYVSRLVALQSQNPVIGRLAAELRRVGDELVLDADGRLELVVACVQAIPYGEVDPEIRLPAETIAYRSGVCTEKSVLLAALLVRGGWDSCLWVFDSQRHVGVGVAADDSGFQGTRFAFIETTAPSYIGQSDAGYRSRGPVARPAQCIELGGWRRYGAGGQTAYIMGVLEIAEKGSVHLAPYRTYADDANAELGARYEDYAELQERATSLAVFIREHTHDRPAVYRALVCRRDAAAVREALSWQGLPR